jgi:hypothetical protein
MAKPMVLVPQAKFKIMEEQIALVKEDAGRTDAASPTKIQDGGSVEKKTIEN